MLQAFKFSSNTIIPFSAVVKVKKVGNLELSITIISAGTFSHKCVTEDDREQQYTNFETWLTAKTNSI